MKTGEIWKIKEGVNPRNTDEIHVKCVVNGIEHNYIPKLRIDEVRKNIVWKGKPNTGAIVYTSLFGVGEDGKEVLSSGGAMDFDCLFRNFTKYSDKREND